MITTLDLNSDMGERESQEGLELDAALMPLLTSVNIACGGHAGSPDLMRRTGRLAAQHGLAIGAHPGFPDREQFGRIERRMASDDLEALIVDQIETLLEALTEEGLTLTHVKPHGALYGMAAREPDIAQIVVKAVQAIDRHLVLYALAGSVLANTGQAVGMTVMQEAFADRAYRTDGSLVPRGEKGAVLDCPDAARYQFHQLLTGHVMAIDGTLVPVKADTLCLHSDTPQALVLARIIRKELTAAGVAIAAPRPHHA